MRFNEGAMRLFGYKIEGEKQGRLHYKSPKEGFKERWFKIHGNLLFYFRTTDFGGQPDGEPLGILVLEKYRLQAEKDAIRPFTFSITFEGEGDKKHLLCAPNSQEYKEWTSRINKASVEELKTKIGILQGKIMKITHKDPLPELCVRHLPKTQAASVSFNQQPQPQAQARPSAAPKHSKPRKNAAELFTDQTGKSSFLNWETFD